MSKREWKAWRRKKREQRWWIRLVEEFFPQMRKNFNPEEWSDEGRRPHQQDDR